jgi:hypothetical protein
VGGSAASEAWSDTEENFGCALLMGRQITWLVKQLTRRSLSVLYFFVGGGYFSNILETPF